MITILDGALVVKAPPAVLRYVMDWDTLNLTAGVTIGTSTWQIRALRPNRADTALTMDQDTIIAGNRKTRIRLSGGTDGQLYEVLNEITTDQVPSQTKIRGWRLLVQL